MLVSERQHGARLGPFGLNDPTGSVATPANEPSSDLFLLSKKVIGGNFRGSFNLQGW